MVETMVPWYNRVHSHSNFSDGFGRLDRTEVRQLDSKDVKADWNTILVNLP